MKSYHSKFALPAVFAFIIVVGYLDYLNGFRLSLYPLYLIPLAIVAWNEPLPLALAAAGTAGVVIAAKYFLFEPTFIEGSYRYWDGCIKIALLLCISFGLFRIRQLLRQKDEMNAQLTKALSEIQELREMIPICAWCHAIRNDQGFYERIEVYLGQLTGANFTHGICPSCKEKYYGDLVRKGEAAPAEETNESKKLNK